MSTTLKDRKIAERTVLQFMGLHHCLACGVPLPNVLPKGKNQEADHAQLNNKIKQIKDVLFAESCMKFNKGHILCLEQLRLIVKLLSLASQATDERQTSLKQPNSGPTWYQEWLDQMQACFHEMGIDHTFRGLHIGEEIVSVMWPMCNSCNLQCSNKASFKETLEQELLDRNITYEIHPMEDDKCIGKLLPYIVTNDEIVANRDKTVQIMTFVLLHAYVVCLENTKRWQKYPNRKTKNGNDSYTKHRASAVSDVYLGYILFVVLTPFLIARHRASFTSFYNDMFSLIFVPWYIGKANEGIHTISDMVLRVNTRHTVSNIGKLLTTRLIPACFHCLFNSVSVSIIANGAYLAVSDQDKSKVQDRVIVNQRRERNLLGGETDYTQMQFADIVDGLTVAFQGASFHQVDTLDWEEFEAVASSRTIEEKRAEYLVRNKFKVKLQRIYGTEAMDKLTCFNE